MNGTIKVLALAVHPWYITLKVLHQHNSIDTACLGTVPSIMSMRSAQPPHAPGLVTQYCVGSIAAGVRGGLLDACQLSAAPSLIDGENCPHGKNDTNNAKKKTPA